MSNKDLLREIQNEAVDGNFDLSTILRKCFVLAFRLGHEPLKNWAQWELNGYPKTSEVPDYRILHGLESFGHFAGIGGSGLQNAPLSILRLPKEIRDNFSSPKIREGVRAIAEMISHDREGAIRWAWPAPAYEIFNHEGYREDLQLMQAWMLVPTSMLAGLLDTIRNRVLDFALEMETIGLKLEEETQSEELKGETAAQITQTFHQTIYGPVSNVGTAGSISQTMIVNRGDLTGLKDSLRETGLPESDLQELEKAIKADEVEPKPAENHFGKHVAKWMGDTVKKAATGLFKVGTDVIATVATKALKDYYGVG